MEFAFPPPADSWEAPLLAERATMNWTEIGWAPEPADYPQAEMQHLLATAPTAQQNEEIDNASRSVSTGGPCGFSSVPKSAFARITHWRAFGPTRSISRRAGS